MSELKGGEPKGGRETGLIFGYEFNHVEINNLFPQITLY